MYLSGNFRCSNVAVNPACRVHPVQGRYEADSRFVAEILPLIPEFFDPHKALHHYLAQHNRAMEDLDAEKTIGIKKLFYALRGFFAALWCLKRKTMPPTLFESLLLPELCPAEILSWIEKLKEEKKNSREMQRIPMPMELYAFFQHRRCFLEQHLSFEKKTQPGMEALNQIFRSFIPEKSENGAFPEKTRAENSIFKTKE